MSGLDVFISYDPQDQHIARAVQKRLEEGGLTCWSETQNLVPGQLWDEVIPARIIEATAVLFLVTANWPTVGQKGSNWYGPEKVALAIELSAQSGQTKHVVPVLIAKGTRANVPYGLRRAAPPEATDTQGARLVSDLQTLLGRTPPKATAEGQPIVEQMIFEADLKGVG